MIRAVVFDVGECLVDETREYGTWADWLGVPRHTFAAQFGATIAQGKDYPASTSTPNATPAPQPDSPSTSTKPTSTPTSGTP
ncbi:hypothetical protein GCM10010231_42110 [Streptomyces sindenensis]|nr:hypothetical protein GCM10010231_42110 [Streptomyces sindenensis]